MYASNEFKRHRISSKRDVDAEISDTLKELRKLIYTTNPIESLNYVIKRKTKSKDLFSSKELAFKVLFTSTQEVMEK